MDDDRKKFPRKNGPRPTGQGRATDGPRSGKPDFGKKPFRAGGAKKPFVKKPFAERPQAGDRPKRQFDQDARPRDGEARAERAAGPFKAGPRPDRKPFEKRERPAGERKPYAERGERKPYVPRPEGDQRPKREFTPRPRRDGEGFQRRERPAGDAPASREGTRSFATKSHEGQRRSYGMKSHEDGDRKPFVKRAGVVEEAPGERIAKRLARAGIASRRDAEELIAAGRVRVNGLKLESPAFNVMPDDTIEVDGTAIPAIERTRLFLFHKPAGLVTTNRDPEGRKTVFDVLPTDLPRLMTIGRLDINTEGLLLLTNDGGLSRVLELPATGWLRRYRVRVHGKVEEKALAGLKDGIAVDGVFYGSIEAALDREQGSNAWLTIGLREGKNREVKNILGALGLDVSRLIRISYGPFQLGDLPEGHVQEIKGRLLRDQLGERLIEESGANFEAPVVNQFPNQPVKRAPEPKAAEPGERPKIVRDGERGRIGEGGLIKKRQRRENTRDEALGKLSTSRPDRPKFDRGDRPERPKLERGERPVRTGKFGDRPDRFATFADKPGAKPTRAGKKPEREQRPIEPPGQRKANVWMAPGARPIGAGRAAAEKAEVEARRAAKKQAYGKPGGKPGFGKPRGERPQGDRTQRDRPDGGKGGPRGPRTGGKDADRRR
ncbi:pseudouridine synthase [Mesorhizobium sp. KR9-304]|uniref:pseudouridine synthase n=1 Tax=Mesorhizobium sp. KR9-304 TaxID=3156614 RepID=UPI0032B4D644